jgi:hypothetical protein
MQFDPLNPDMRDYHNDERTMVPVEAHVQRSCW